MTLLSLLVEKKTAVLQRWCDLIVDTYPDGAREFLSGQKDRFQNPIGYVIIRNTEALYDALLAGPGSDAFSSSIDDIVRIRAVQDFTASQAVAFVFQLKRAIREQLGPEMFRNGFVEQLLDFESRIDDFALLTFDTYMRCREKVYDIRVDQARNGIFKLRERLNLPRKREESSQPPETGDDGRSLLIMKESRSGR